MRSATAGVLLVLCGFSCVAQAPDEDQLGAWYMYFFTKRFGEGPLGIQGDYQYRSWNLGSDLEQLLLRTGMTYRPKDTDVTFTAGYVHVTTGAFGESDASVAENRVYQEANIPHKVGSRVLLAHRFRYEQRWMEGLDFRTRYRYNIFVYVPLNHTKIEHKTVYVVLYNELFINGQKSVGNGISVEYFDRNRTYFGMGYGLKDNLRMQAGWMYQLTDNWGKGQMQLSLHSTF